MSMPEALTSALAARNCFDHEPRDDLADVTTAELRLAMVWDVSRRMWALTCRPFPSHTRENLPGHILRRP